MQFEKRQVRLGDIRPSGQNPREDFGDIGALARSIEATGGEPLNPPVVVADGNVYRIVDGERRYRALSSIYGEDREVSALVAESMDEANELVAMLATDDKRQLTEAERARGVQQMLVLGIDEQRIERASRATAGQIRAARRLRGRIDAGAQVTLEQLEAASAFDDEKDVEAVLAAGDGWAGKVDSIRRRVEREESIAEDYDALGDAGIPVVKEVPEGFAYVYWANLGTVAEKLKGIDVTGFVAVRKNSYWDLYRPDDGSGAESEKTEEEIRAEQEAAREEAALKGAVQEPDWLRVVRRLCHVQGPHGACAREPRGPVRSARSDGRRQPRRERGALRARARRVRPQPQGVQAQRVRGRLLAHGGGQGHGSAQQPLGRRRRGGVARPL